jgi:hypothetical protein
MALAEFDTFLALFPIVDPTPEPIVTLLKIVKPAATAWFGQTVHRLFARRQQGDVMQCVPDC